MVSMKAQLTEADLMPTAQDSTTIIGEDYKWVNTIPLTVELEILTIFTDWARSVIGVWIIFVIESCSFRSLKESVQRREIQVRWMQ